MPNVEQMFSIPIYKKNLGDLNLQSFRQRVLKLMDVEDYGDHISVVGMKDGNTINTYGIERHMQTWKESDLLLKEVNTALAEYWKELNYHPDLQPYIQEMWATLSTRGGFVPSHFHGPTPITAVFYLDKTDNAGDLTLQHPLEALLGSQPINFPFDEFAQTMNVQQNDLMMFPGYIRHFTEKNKTDSIRISIGMNIGSKGTYVSSQWSQV